MIPSRVGDGEWPKAQVHAVEDVWYGGPLVDHGWGQCVESPDDLGVLFRGSGVGEKLDAPAANVSHRMRPDRHARHNGIGTAAATAQRPVQIGILIWRRLHCASGGGNGFILENLIRCEAKGRAERRVAPSLGEATRDADAGTLAYHNSQAVPVCCLSSLGSRDTGADA